MTDFAIIQRKFEREKMARQEAETLLEKKSLELYQAQEQLKKANEEILGRIKLLESALTKTKEMLVYEIRQRLFTEARNQAIFNTAVDAIVTIDSKGYIETFNHAAEKIFGYTENEILGENVSVLMHSPEREMHDSYIAGYLSNHRSNIIGVGREVVGRHKNGSEIPLHLAVSEIKIGEQHLFAGILRDISDIKKAQEELEEARRQEKAIGWQIQQMLLLGKPPQSIQDIQLAAITLPSRDVNGDFYDFLKHNDCCFDLILGDVMGKGIPAALIGSGTKSRILRILSTLCLHSPQETIPSPACLIESLLSDMFEDLIALDSFVTLCYARFDMNRRAASFIDCGHTKTIHYRYQKKLCETISSDNLPIGMLENDRFEEIDIPFDDGDIFLFYSDGITEAHNTLGEMFGEERLAQLVIEECNLPPDALLDTVFDRVHAFSQKDSFSDDFSCIAVKIGSNSSSKIVNVCNQSFPGQTIHLASIRDFITEQSRQSGLFNDEETDQWVLAVQEAVTNIIKHAFNHTDGKNINLSIKKTQSEMTVTITYEGEKFDPTNYQQTEFNEIQESGFGLFIISQSVDVIKYYTDLEGFQNIRLTKTAKSNS